MSESIANTESRTGGEHDDPVDALVAQCLDSGESDLQSALETTCRAHPEHAHEIRRRVSALEVAGLLRDPARRATTARDEAFPERLGDFRLLERLGGGGMGVVFRARQEALGREVALKLIRPEHMFFPRARERFRRETEAVARLQHAGIVPIYTVGEEAGVPYFAMELVTGATLGQLVELLHARAPESLRGSDLRDALLRASPRPPDATGGVSARLFTGSWVEACLVIAVQVARALHHAHGRGVLHRDVKPSNIALGFDGRAMLLDFGLATLEAEVRITQQGSALGSLLYMAPEQIRGDARGADARTDVYALGVTLYELLTLQAPYHDTNAIATRQAILEGRADSIRVRNRSVPRDLETVCFKAMERDPARRYADAEAFARDLENVLELRPIEARPPSATLRVRRWVQRNPARSVALALSAVLVVVTPSALWWQQLVHASDLKKERDEALAAKKDADAQRVIAVAATDDANHERDRAQLEARESDAAAEFMAKLFGGADPTRMRGRELTALELLDEGVARIDRELAGEPELRARLLTRLGETYASLGKHERALPLLESSLALREELFGEESRQVAEGLFSLSSVQYALGDARALESARRALALRERVDPTPDAQLARFMVALANATLRDGDIARAIGLYSEAREIQASLTGDQRELRELILANEANAWLANRDFERAVELAREAADLERELFDGRHPGLVASLNTQVLALKGLGRLEEAREVAGEMLELGSLLHGEESDRYAILLMSQASLSNEMGDYDAAFAQYERALAICARTVGVGSKQRVTCAGNLAALCVRTQRFERGRELFRELVPVLTTGFGADNTRVVTARTNLALCCEALGEFDGAEEALRGVLATPGDEAANEAREVRVRAHLARVLARSGRAEEGARELAPALERAAKELGATAALVRFSQALCTENASAQAHFDALAALADEPKDAEWVRAAARVRRLATRELDAESREQLVAECERLAELLGSAHVETKHALALAEPHVAADSVLTPRLRALLDR